MHGRDHCPGGPDPIPCLSNYLPAAYCHGTAFEAEDGAYYALAQTVGSDPNAFGVADSITVWNDADDPSLVGSYFRRKSVGSGLTLQIFAGTGEGGGNVQIRFGYDGIVEFDGPIDTDTILAQLYLGTGVGGGVTAHHIAYLEPVAASRNTSYLHLSGEVTKEMEGFDPSTSGIPNTPDLSPILLVEGANVDVTETWFELTILSELHGEIIT